jgi:hypothetical protein
MESSLCLLALSSEFGAAGNVRGQCSRAVGHIGYLGLIRLSVFSPALAANSVDDAVSEDRWIDTSVHLS